MSIFSILLVASLAIHLNAQSLNTPNCGQRPFASNTKIVSGFKAKVGDWSWSISMLQNGRHFCGGVLINSQWVLTAAHCFPSLSASVVSSTSIDIGVSNRFIKESWVVNRKAALVIKHENFNLQTLANDIALVKLSTPITLDDKYYIPACLPVASSGLDFDSQGKTAWLTGWGSTYFQGPITTDKMEVSVVLITDARCKQKYGQALNPLSQICAVESNDNKGACQGDSGGPFVRQMDDGRWYVIGLISWGYGCGQGTVFTRVTYFMDWITNKISNN